MRKSLLTLMSAVSTVVLAAAPTTAERTIFANSDLLPGYLDPGFESLPWPDGADLSGAEGGTPLDRWTRQAEAGRARAAAIMGRYWLEQVPQDPGNCVKAIEWFTRADKLGSNEAPTWLGHLFRRLDCPQRNLATAAQWLRQAVPLVSYGAAADLFSIYADSSAPEADPALAVTYGRIAAANGEFGAGDIDSPARLAALEKSLDARRLKTATELSGKLLADIQKRREQLSAAPREEKLKISAASADWSVDVVAFDELRECTANTAGNCKGVRRATYLDVLNKSREYLRCTLAVDHHDFAVSAKATSERETLLPPAVSRRLLMGRLGEVASADLRVSCSPVPGLAETVAQGKCRVTATGIPSVADFYPAGSKRRNEEGRVVLNIWMDQKEGHPALVELKESSGYAELDMAGVKMGSYMAFKGDCDQGYTAVAVAFRLAD